MIGRLKNSTLKRTKSSSNNNGSFTGESLDALDETKTASPSTLKKGHSKRKLKSGTSKSKLQVNRNQSTLGLKAILDDIETQLQFEEFLDQQHASENLRLWQELKYYRYGLENQIHEVDISENVEDKENVDKSKSVPAQRKSKKGEFKKASSLRKKSALFLRKASLRKSAPSKVGATTANSNKAKESEYYVEAKRLYDTYIADNAPNWVCTDDDTVKSLKQQLEKHPESIDKNFFAKVENQLFRGMQEDLLPRFLKKISLEQGGDS